MLTNAELDFLAQDELVSVVSNFKISKLHFISDDYGPFRPGGQLKIPYWLAITLKKRKRIAFVPPAWFSAEKVKQHIDAERQKENALVFSSMPSMYIEHAQLLVWHAGEDIPELDAISLLVEELIDIRLSKLRQALKTFVDPLFLDFKNVTPMEINIFRSIIASYMDFRFKFASLAVVAFQK